VKQLTKYFGILSLIIAAANVIYCAHKQSFDLFGKQPLSYLGTTSSQSVFRVGLIVSVLFMLGFYLFIKSQYQTSRSYLFLFIIAMIAETVFAIIPEQLNGKAQITHWIAAWVFVVCLAISVVLFARLNQATKVGKISMYLGVTFVVVLIPEVFLYILGVSASFSQIFNAVIFGVWVTYITLLASTQPTDKVQ
jgi:hypothetical membrane protein